MYVLVTCDAGVGKTFIVISIFQSLIRLYNNIFGYDPPQLKGTIAAYIGKVEFNAGGIMLHFAFYLPFNKLEYFLIKNEKLDTLTKNCEQICIMLIDEASLIGSTLLYQVDKFFMGNKAYFVGLFWKY